MKESYLQRMSKLRTPKIERDAVKFTFPGKNED